MTVTYEDYYKLTLAKKQKPDAEAHDQRIMTRVVGVQMEELMNKPDWKLYLDSVNLILERKTGELKALEAQLLSEEDPKVRKDYTFLKGVVWGLTNAISCGKTVVQNGKMAAKALAEEAEDVRRN